MTFISIGSTCNVKHQITKCVKSQETYFFDWLGTDMNTVNLLFQERDKIHDYFHPANIIKHSVTNDNHSRVYVKHLPKCISIHDLKAQYTTQDLELFVHKYTTRFKRIVQLIKSSNPSNNPLYFIRYGKIEEEEKNTFIETILNINSSCLFTLVSINIEQPTDTLYADKHYLEMNFTTQQVVNDWTTSFLDWNTIFTTIQTFQHKPSFNPSFNPSFKQTG